MPKGQAKARGYSGSSHTERQNTGHREGKREKLPSSTLGMWIAGQAPECPIKGWDPPMGVQAGLRVEGK